MSTARNPHMAGRAARIVLRPTGNPLPLGFLALAGGTLLVSGLHGWLRPQDGGGQVAVQLTSPPGATSDALGLFLLLATTSVRYATTGLYELTASPTWEDVAGVAGLVLCALAVYAALAMALEDARRETVLPLGRRGAGAESLNGNLDDQIARIEREAGVREQL